MFRFSSNNYFVPNDAKVGIKESRGGDITVNVFHFVRILFYQLKAIEF